MLGKGDGNCSPTVSVVSQRAVRPKFICDENDGLRFATNLTSRQGKAFAPLTRATATQPER